MALDPFVAEITIFAGNFAPTGWAFCNGQVLPISQNTALFSLLGTMYGGDGQSTFALPNLQGRSPIGQGHGQALSNRVIGEQGGQSAVTLLSHEAPAHTHTMTGSAAPTLRCVSTAGNRSTPVGNVPAAEAFGATAVYGASPDDTTMALPVTTAAAGSGLPHNNESPCLGLTFIIALQGVFPPR
jgi:microcystin-dependent protein